MNGGNFGVRELGRLFLAVQERSPLCRILITRTNNSHVIALRERKIGDRKYVFLRRLGEYGVGYQTPLIPLWLIKKFGKCFTFILCNNCKNFKVSRNLSNYYFVIQILRFTASVAVSST